MPRWSADGEKIAFFSARDGNFEIYVMNSDGTEKNNVTGHPASDGAPAWSPSGNKITFHSNRFQNQQDIYVMNVDGSKVTRLTNNKN